MTTWGSIGELIFIDPHVKISNLTAEISTVTAGTKSTETDNNSKAKTEKFLAKKLKSVSWETLQTEGELLHNHEIAADIHVCAGYLQWNLFTNVDP